MDPEVGILALCGVSRFSRLHCLSQGFLSFLDFVHLELVIALDDPNKQQRHAEDGNKKGKIVEPALANRLIDQTSDVFPGIGVGLPYS